MRTRWKQVVNGGQDGGRGEGGQWVWGGAEAGVVCAPTLPSPAPSPIYPLKLNHTWAWAYPFPPMWRDALVGMGMGIPPARS